MKYGLLLIVSITYFTVMEFPSCFQCRSLSNTLNNTVMNFSQNSKISYDLNNSTLDEFELDYQQSNVSSNNTSVSETYNVTSLGNLSVIALTQSTLHSTTTDENLKPPKKELPMAMIIAGPAAAVGIVLFLCILYYWHTVQLDQRAKEFSFTMYITPEPSTDLTVAGATSNGSISRHQKLVPAPPSRQLSRESSDLHFQRRKSTLTIPSMNLPPPSMGKRGSSWSALADQELLNITSPRRHSTFIL